MAWMFALAMFLYLMIIYGLAIRASTRIHSKEDFVLAGRQLSLPISVVTLVATWFGAESLMTVANEVAQSGFRQAMLDPIGISLCLLLTGWFLAKKLWRMNLLTIGDFFRIHYGPFVEKLATWVLFPSYFGWIGAQLMAMGTVMETFFGWPPLVTIVGVAVIGTGYAWLGGMWSVSWIDAAQLLIIAIGLIALLTSMFVVQGYGDGLRGIDELIQSVPVGFWSLKGREDRWANLSMALSALAIGALGNLPVQDLLQRVLSAKSDRVAAWSCHGAAVGYLLLGSIPIALGLGAAVWMPEAVSEGRDVVTTMSMVYLNPGLQIMFLLAIISAVLSTMVSAIMSPAALVGHNLIEPWLRRRRNRQIEPAESLWLQRASIVGVATISVAVTRLGSSAYELLEASYAMGLVGLTVPFLAAVIDRRPSRPGAVMSIVIGGVSWSIHLVMGWEWFGQPWSPPVVSQEIGSAILSLIGYLIGRLAWPGPAGAVRELGAETG